MKELWWLSWGIPKGRMIDYLETQIFVLLRWDRTLFKIQKDNNYKYYLKKCISIPWLTVSNVFLKSVSIVLAWKTFSIDRVEKTKLLLMIDFLGWEPMLIDTNDVV